jgi:hypothetical protein
MKFQMTKDKYPMKRRGEASLKFLAMRNSKFEIRNSAAFTLIEAMMAIGIFFMAIFAILSVVMQNVRAAHSLNQLRPTPGMIAAELSMTNKLEEGSETGDFGDLYPDYTWSRDILMAGTNGLFQVDIVVYHEDRHGYRHQQNEDAHMSVLLFKPESTQGVGGSAGQMKFSGKAKK